ncbi:MAG: 5-oxoprolinase subunit PxpB [Rhodocyclaceae bacterium]|nr:5-oxoprolinase subunit PxpB [Rhodocyclaceae bacterium]
MNYRLLDAGDRAVTIEFGDALDADCIERVAALGDALRGEIRTGALVGVLEVVPTFRSLSVVFDPLRLPLADLEKHIATRLGALPPRRPEAARCWRLPVCYGGPCGPDLDDVARRLDCTTRDIVAWHSQAEFRVAMLGFLPGFAFMTGLPARLHLPRRTEPRVRVPSGSVAVATALTAIYPWESPGGWHLLGRCPIPLFDPAAESPALLAPGDRVRFEPVHSDRFSALATRDDAAALARDCLETPPP